MIARPVRAACRLAERCGSAWRKTLARLRFGRAIRFGRGVWLEPGVGFEIFDGGTIDIGANTFVGRNALVGARGGHIAIGRDSLVNTGCVIVSTARVAIGQGALIAEHVTIRDQDHAHGDPDRPYWQQGRSEAPVAIGANVWLGAKVTVTKGVSIADGCIVGANSVVTRTLAKPAKYAGAPARRIGALPGRT